MSLYLRGAIWWCRVRNPKGGRCLQLSTGCKDRAAAVIRYCEFEREYALHHVAKRVKTGPAKINGGVVYFLQSETGLIKIGCSTNLDARIRHIRAMSPAQLELLGSMPGGHREERAAHAKLQSWRDHGEWFRSDAESLAIIKSLIKAAA